MEKRNYQRELDSILDTMEEKRSLLLHCCCAPCSSYVTEYLHHYFDITVFFYNPNITEEPEYAKRKQELMRYLGERDFGKEIDFLDADYDPESFLEMAKGLENEPERGRRCEKCFHLRLAETGKRAKEGGFDYFCTTLSISPHKDAALLNAIGEMVGEELGVPYLPSDFKKKGGYQRSIELSREYNLYRQSFCGCVFSKEAANQK